MYVEQNSRPDCSVDVTNVGGISEAAIEFSPGVTILEGRNATNRTSMLQALKAALGSDNVAIKADADEASVELTLGEETYTSELTRQGGTVVSGGDPYLEDPELAELFAFLLESNETRRAVARGENLRDILMRPVDTDEIEAEIARLIQRRKQLEGELDEIDGLKGKLPSLEQERTQLTSQIEEKRAELDAKAEELETADRDVQETREEKAELETKLDELRSKRATLDDIRYDIETERETRTQLQQERQDLEAELADLAEAPAGDIAELEQRLDDLRDRKQVLETQLNDLQSVVRFNEEMLEDASGTIAATLEGEASQDVTDKLLPESEITCWTCGSTVDTDQIETTLEQLRERQRETFADVRSLEDDIDELAAERKSLERSRQERERIERRLDRLSHELEESEQTVERLQQRRTEVTEAIERVEAEVDSLEEDDYGDGDILDLHREANQLEYDLGRLESQRDRIEEELSSIEKRVGTEPELEAQLEDVRGEIEGLRTKIERLEQDTIEQFNDHMETVLDILDYDNLDRIWLERIEREVRDGRRKVDQTVFELHVVRSTASGTAYEDTIDHLSESEREVTGLVFALAGYLAHRLYEDLPFMLLDSLEAIDADRLAALIEYFSDYTGYLVVALLPEDAAKLEDSYERITEM